MRVPIRVYPHVSVDRPPQPYDLLWPVARRKEAGSQGKVTELDSLLPQRPKVPTLNRKSHSTILGLLFHLLTPATIGETSSLDEVRAYAYRLLRVAPAPRPAGLRVKIPPDLVSSGGSEDDEEEAAMPGCMEAVEILTRNPKKGDLFKLFCLMSRGCY
jgi:RAB6A-GEF complex partner protein 2